MKNSNKYIAWFDSIDRQSINSVGGKNAALGEMFQSLTPLGIKVPNGFAITADAYRALLDRSMLWDKLRALMTPINGQNVALLANNAKQARDLIRNAEIPPALADAIKTAYRGLQQEYGESLTVAVRSSATAEDLPNASFAGQHETYLNISGEQALLKACSDCMASLFTDRAIVYRINNGFDHFQVALSVGVMKMIRADCASSGVMFSLDTESGYRDAVFITGSYGLGETIVQGIVDPDEFYVHKPTFELGHRTVLSHHLGDKEIKMVYANDGVKTDVKTIPTTTKEQQQFCLTDSEILSLADYAIKTEIHFSNSFGDLCPMDMEWAKDGIDGQLYLIQARPETVVSQRPTNILESYRLTDEGSQIATGRAVGQRIATGTVRIISDKQQLGQFKPGEILVASTTHPDWVTVMATAGGVITEHGGRTCHAAIVARELGIPAIVGVYNATELLRDGQIITVSCADGSYGEIYDGALSFAIDTHNLDELASTKTEIMLNIASPDKAFKASQLPAAGVGLARTEFIINNHIKAHPMALINPVKTDSPSVKQQLAELIKPYQSGSDFFVAKLAEGIGMIAAAFYPRPVVVRFSDFKTNEYASLLGGKNFEPREENPMLGFRGAVRYGHPDYAAGFALECAALKFAREQMGLTNIIPMVPFCRSVKEAQDVIAAMAEHGLAREDADSDAKLQIFMMCEVPNNVIRIGEFCELFDGISIGSNDLTQLVLGVDRDSDLVASEFDERDPGVLEMMRQAILGAQKHDRYIGICGQAPSDYPEVAEFLVKLGINSISLNPDALLNILPVIAQIEKDLENNNSNSDKVTS
ncbi:MAG: pyruvate,water dikinase [Arenicella sp.]|jgi:pyruvate,water dikinase